VRHVIPSLLLTGCLAHPGALALSAQGGAAAGKPTVHACSLLTKALVMKVSPESDNKLLFVVPAQEESLGSSGSACGYGGIQLQIDPPFTFETIRKTYAKEVTAVPNVGDGAYFRDNRGRYAELFARVGARLFTIQMSVPMGRTADSIKPNVVALANEIVPKLK
jgi:hypothetical protein